MGRIAGIIAAALLMAACSTAPRRFEPVFAAGPADPQTSAVVQACEAEMGAGVRSGGRVASAGAGAAAGAATGAVLMGSSGGTMVGTMAAATATMAVAPVAIVVAAVSVSHAIRARKERDLKGAMADCLAEKGHVVSSWNRAARPGKNPAAP